MAKGIIRLNSMDNVVIALEDLPPGRGLTGWTDPWCRPSRAATRSPRALAAGERVVRYGQIIGQATVDVPAFAHVHSHNLGMGPHSDDYAIGQDCRPLPPLEPLVFNGFHRPDGTVGTRNYLGILTSVNCSGSVARFIAEAAERDPVLAAAPIDGIVPIVHQTGCGMSGTNEGYATLMRTLKGYARNPNFGGILLVAWAARSCKCLILLDKGACDRTATSAT